MFVFGRNFKGGCNKEFFKNYFSSFEQQEEFSPSVNIIEDNDRFVIQTELAGVKKEDIKIEIVDSKLIISGQRRSIYDELEKENSNESKTTSSSDSNEKPIEHEFEELSVSNNETNNNNNTSTKNSESTETSSDCKQNQCKNESQCNFGFENNGHPCHQGFKHENHGFHQGFPGHHGFPFHHGFHHGFHHRGGHQGHHGPHHGHEHHGPHHRGQHGGCPRKFFQRKYNNKFLVKEIESGKFKKEVPLKQENLKLNEINASFENGLLTITLLKKEQVKFNVNIN